MKKWKHGLITTIAVFSILSTTCATTGTSNNGLSLLNAVDQGSIELAQNFPPKTRIAVVDFKSSSAKLSEYIIEMRLKIFQKQFVLIPITHQLI
jgi:hypothetical protein